MIHTRKQLSRRLNASKRKSIFRSKDKPAGLAVKIAVIFGCCWLIAFLGAAAWYLRKNDSYGRSSSVVGVERLAKRRNEFALLRQQREWKKEKVEEPTEVPGLQTGVKHIPNLQPLSDDPDAYLSPLLIFTCKRQKYLSQTLDDILNNIGSHCAFGCPVIVSEDGAHDLIHEVITEYSVKFRARGIPLIHMQHDQLALPKNKRLPVHAAYAYRALAHHYGWALTQVFNGLDRSLPIPDRVIILEEDIHTSPDFFSYMKATSRLLDKDDTLFVVSAYNDNGHMAQDPYRILRSDFFPGLGWMMTRRLWNDELEAKWPRSYWDDWMREPAQRKKRHILRPEVSRTFHFGEKGGSSHNQFGSILSRVKRNEENIDWCKQDLSYLQEQLFDKNYGKLIASSMVVTSVKQAEVSLKKGNTRLEYNSLNEFESLAIGLDIMQDEKASIPRTAYKGVVEIRPYGEHFLFLTPPAAKLKESFPSFSP